MPKLNIRIGDGRHAEWMDYCEENGIVSAEVIRDFIDSKLAGRTKPPRPKLIRKVQPKREVTLRLTESEIEGVRLRAMLNGGTRAGYIIRVLRADLARAPALEDTATQALRDHTDAINAIGRNLNQIAKSLHRNQMPDRSLQIGQLVSDINAQSGLAQELIDVCYTRCAIAT